MRSRFALATLVLLVQVASEPALAAQGFKFSQEDESDRLEQEARQSKIAELGLKTYTPDEIRRQIAQAEIDAYFKNDPDAMLNASKRLGASFVLRGLISSEATRNPMMAVNQVTVNMKFTLYGSDGRLISDTEASSGSYAGANIERMALTLVNEKADEVVPALYADYCRKAGPAAARKPALQ